MPLEKWQANVLSAFRMEGVEIEGRRAWKVASKKPRKEKYGRQ